MKTKEEILEDYFPTPENDEEMRDNILIAMDEYATQRLIEHEGSKWVNLEKREPPKEVGEYLIYGKENDTMGTSYWNGTKWGHDGKEDNLVSHYREKPSAPLD